MQHNQTLRLRPAATSKAGTNALFALLDIDFPAGARIPLPLLRASLRQRRIRAVYLSSGRTVYGYAIYQQAPVRGILHILYLAVLPRYRSRGLGSVLLRHLGSLAPKGIWPDVEDPAAHSGAGRQACQKRIAFYQRNGYRLHPSFGFSNFGYQMRVMSNTPLPRINWLRCYRRLYNNAYGCPISHWLVVPRHM